MYLCDSQLLLSIFHGKRQPPDLHELPFFVEVIHHFLDGVAGKRVGARIPVTVSIEPAIVERRPLDAKLFEFRNRAQSSPPA